MSKAADRPRCTALTRAGDQCSRRAMPGELLCRVHAGASKPVGRRSKLDRDVLEELVELAGHGNYREQMARAAGVSPSTLYAWLERGEADLDAGKATIHAELSEALTRAEANAEANALAHIRRHAPLDWRAEAWFLERRYPSRYRRRDSLEVEGELTTKTVEDVAPDSDEERRRTAEILASAGVLDHELEELTKTTKPKKRGKR